MENNEITLDSLIEEGHIIKKGLILSSGMIPYYSFTDKNKYEI